MKTTVGNLLDATELVIAHGVNCKGVMGAGVAHAIAKKWPLVEKQYIDLCKHDCIQLGSCWIIDADSRLVANLATQHNPGPHATYAAVEVSMWNLYYQMMELKIPLDVAIPEIGCGIGGLKWPEVERILFKIPLIFNVYRLK